MLYMKLPDWKYRTTTLALIAAIAILAALLALSPSLVQGASGVVEGVAASAGDASPVPGISPQQVGIASPATMRECKEERDAGRSVQCKANSFSVKTIRPDGGYNIDWSRWASQHSNVDRYSIQRLRFLYLYNFEREDNGDAVEHSDYTVPHVNSCVPRGAEVNSRREVTRWAWNCSGIGQIEEDPFGVPTSIEQLEAFEDNWTSQNWTGSLLAPGRKPDVPVQAFRIPGSKTDPHVDNPQSLADRLTQQQVDDDTHDLLATEIEMHLYLITVHFDDGTTLRRYDLIDAGPFDDR